MRRVILIALAVALLGLGSCIEFETQTLTFRYDSGTDTLRIFQVYEGIYGAKSEGVLNDQEEGQLLSVFQRQRTFFFANWIFEYDEKMMQELIKDVAEEPDDPRKPPEKIALRQEQQLLCELLLANVEVENGPFFMNADQKLSGYQHVTLRDASKVVAQANKLISTGVLFEIEKHRDRPGGPDAETVRRLEEAAKSGHQWLTLEQSRIRARFPLSYAEAMRIRREFVEDWRRALDQKEGRESAFEEIVQGLVMFMETEVWVSYRDDTVEVAVGHPSNAATSVSLTIHPGKYKPNVVAFAKQNGGIAENVDVAKARDAFLSGAPAE